MAFERREYVDREVQFPGRRKLINVEDELDIELVDIERTPTSVTQQGDRFKAGDDNTQGTMNNLEKRVETAFNLALQKLNTIIDKVYPVGAIYQSFRTVSPATLYPGTAWTKLPDNRVLVPATSNIGQNTGNASNIISRAASSVGVNLSGSVQNAYAELRPHTHTFSDTYPETTGTEYKAKNSSTTSGLKTNDSWTSLGSDYETGRDTTFVGGGQPHNHSFSASGTFTGTSVNINITQPYTTIYAWRRIS